MCIFSTFITWQLFLYNENLHFYTLLYVFMLSKDLLVMV